LVSTKSASGASTSPSPSGISLRRSPTRWRASRRETWELFALQGRTELLGLALHRAGRPVPGECTSVCCPASALVAQNWDWDPCMSAFIVILRLPRSGDGRPQMLTLTEAGIVGKVGINEHGVGACINILFGQEPADSPDVVPVHILARAALSAESLDGAEAILRSAPRHCHTHLLLSDSHGRYRMVEFCGKDLAVLGKEHDAQATPPTARSHTNHFLHPRYHGVDADSDLCHTRERHKRAEEIIRAHGGGRRPGEGMDLVRRVLGDREGQPKSILYSSAPGITPQRTLATLCSMIFDLRGQKMHVTRGDALRQDYAPVPLWSSSASPPRSPRTPLLSVHRKHSAYPRGAANNRTS